MKRLSWLLMALAVAGGCATTSDEIGDTGSIVGEIGDPRNRAKLHTELASLYYSSGNLPVALEELRIATSADSSYAPAYGMLGLVYMQLRENPRAQESFERALRISPNDADINHNYGWFLCQTDREAASINYFLNAVRNPLYPTPWRSYSAAGLCNMKVNKFKDAEAFFERALKLEPDEPSALLQFGQLRYKQGNMGDARKLVQRYNKVASPNSESLWLALRVERRMGERVAEQGFANQLRRRFPNSPELQLLLRGQYD